MNEQEYVLRFLRNLKRSAHYIADADPNGFKYRNGIVCKILGSEHGASSIIFYGLPDRKYPPINAEKLITELRSLVGDCLPWLDESTWTLHEPINVVTVQFKALT